MIKTGTNIADVNYIGHISQILGSFTLFFENTTKHLRKLVFACILSINDCQVLPNRFWVAAAAPLKIPSSFPKNKNSY
ncbi:MAG: hypothetical protein HQ568_09490 [Calditrichaeota bacterium]|nr:hypothetical protein [Calditrichota bacterium]